MLSENENGFNLQLKKVTQLPHGNLISLPESWSRDAFYPEEVVCAIGDLILISTVDKRTQIIKALNLLTEKDLFHPHNTARLSSMERVT